MRKYWHWVFTLLFVWALAYDLAVWVPALWGRGPAAILGAGALVHLCVLAGVRAPLALFGAWLLWDQIRSADQRSG